MDNKKDKIKRVLEIYSRLLNGSFVNKRDEAARYSVNERSIQRDIDDIRDFLETGMRAAGAGETVVYDRAAKGYRLEENGRLKLSGSEILALCKILLDSRAFPKAEMSDLLDRLVSCCVPRESRRLVKEMIGNEMFHYIELQHKTSFLDTMWSIQEEALHALHSFCLWRSC